MDTDDGAVADDRLRLIFTCCHPALALPARVALTLRTLGGLTTGEIARAFLVAEPTMAQRLVAREAQDRATRASPTACRRTRRCPTGCAGVLPVVYLIFNEGYARDRGRPARPRRAVQRGDPARPAARAADARRRRGPRAARADAAARRAPRRAGRRARPLRPARPTRTARAGTRDGSARGRPRSTGALACAAPARTSCRRRSPLQHVGRRRPTGRRSPSSTARSAGSRRRRSSRSTARSPSGSPTGRRPGLALLEPLLDDRVLAGYQPLHAAHAELLRRAGDRAGAAEAYRRGIALSANAVERAELERRLQAL